MPDLDPAGLEAAAKAMTSRWNMPSISWENYVQDATVAITAYLASSDLTRLTAVAMNELTKRLNEVCGEVERVRSLAQEWVDRGSSYATCGRLILAALAHPEGAERG